MPAPTSRMVDGAYQRRDTQVPPYEWDGSLFVVWGKREGRRPPPREGWGRRPCGIRRGDCAICGWRFGTMGEFAPCAARGFRPLRRAGISPRARGDQRRCLWTPRFWAARRSLARVVGEEFCVRPRCGFAAILDVWQEATPQAWRKRPGEHRRHTDGGRPSQEKNRVKLLTFLWRRRLLIFGQEGERQNHFEQVAVHRQLHSAVLQLRQAPGNGQSQSVALTMARFIAPDKPFH